MSATFTIAGTDNIQAIKALVDRHNNSPRKLFDEVGQLWGPNLSMFIDRPVYVYFHGKLESRLGYDIPVFLEGQVSRVNSQEVQIIDPVTEEILSGVLYLYNRSEFIPNSLYGLIVFPDDLEDVQDELFQSSNRLTPIT